MTAPRRRLEACRERPAAPAARGARVGAALLNEAIAPATDAGSLRITLLTDADNDGAHRFYARHVFSASQTRSMRRFPSSA